MEDYKIGYSFLPTTGEFISEEVVYLEKRTGNYPHAENVTFIKPPETNENQKAVWNGNGWIVLDDLRGRHYWDKDGKVLGIIEELGFPTDKIIIAPPELKAHELVKFDFNINNWEIYLEKGYIRDKDGSIRGMTLAEKIEAGLEKLNEDYEKIENGKIVFKTLDERFNEGRITVEQYNEEIDRERQSRFRSETDKYGLMYLRGECTMDEWISAMNKIREELPKK